MTIGFRRSACWKRGGHHKDFRIVKAPEYFRAIRSRLDRVIIKNEWIERVIAYPERERVQADGRVRRWARIDEKEGRYLRVILLPDRETVHNAFFDRGFKL
jgi:hypothetical protein